MSGRRKAVSADQMLDNEPLLALPPPRVVTGGHKTEHTIDPYQAPPGAVPGKVSNLRETKSPKKKATAADLAAREQARELSRLRGNRYKQYNDLLLDYEGDQCKALATVFGVSLEEARDRFYELHAEVRTGIGSTDIGEVLAQHGLDMSARARNLQRWMYSENPAASLKATDMANEMEGGSGEIGSFEFFLRTAKAQRGT